MILSSSSSSSSSSFFRWSFTSRKFCDHVKTSFPLVPLLLPNISGVQQKDTKPKPNKQKHREKFEYYLPYFGWSKSFATTVRSKLHSALSGSLSLALSLSLSRFCSLARALHRRAFKARSSTRDKQASSRDFSFLSLRAQDLIKGLCIG